MPLEDMPEILGTYCFGTEKEIERLRMSPHKRSGYDLVQYAHFGLTAATFFTPWRILTFAASSDLVTRGVQSLLKGKPSSNYPGLFGFFRQTTGLMHGDDSPSLW